MADQTHSITYKEITDGNIEICRDLCNALIAHQADHGKINSEVLRAMNFDTRFKPSFENADKKQLFVAFDGDKPVGYAFSTAAVETEASKAARPAWTAGLPQIQETGFYPDWLPMPQKIGCLSNLYVSRNTEAAILRTPYVPKPCAGCTACQTCKPCMSMSPAETTV